MLTELGEVNGLFEKHFELSLTLIESLPVGFERLFNTLLAEDFNSVLAIPCQFFGSPLRWLSKLGSGHRSRCSEVEGKLHQRSGLGNEQALDLFRLKLRQPACVGPSLSLSH